MAEKLNAENIEAAVQHLENIQTGKTPILSELKGNIKEKEKKVFPLIPPNDPRLLMQVAPFSDDTLEQFGFADRKELSKVMYDNMVKYGGLGSLGGIKGNTFFSFSFILPLSSLRIGVLTVCIFSKC